MESLNVERDPSKIVPCYNVTSAPMTRSIALKGLDLGLSIVARCPDKEMRAGITCDTRRATHSSLCPPSEQSW